MANEVKSIVNTAIADVKNIFGLSISSVKSWDGCLIVLGADRGVYGGGSSSNVLDYISISTTGDAINFGDLILADSCMGTSNGTGNRGLFVGGTNNSSNRMEYITITTLGNATDFGDLIMTCNTSACANGTNNKGIFSGGWPGGASDYVNNIQYATITTPANASDGGDLVYIKMDNAGLSNSTGDRGIEGGDWSYHPKVMTYTTISTAANSSIFGYLSPKKAYLAGVSNGTSNKGVYASGYYNPDGGTNILEYITINSTGDGTDFGDASYAHYSFGQVANSARGVYANYSGSAWDHLEYITFASLANAVNFGSLTVTRAYEGGVTNDH